jgi:metallo-beta-lactamase class B
MNSVAEAQTIDVLISNHSRVDGSQAKLAELRRQGPGKPNPFVQGTPTVERALTVMDECAQAQRDRFLLQ